MKILSISARNVAIAVCLLAALTQTASLAQESKKIRVYVTDSNSWTVSGAWGAGGSGGAGAGGGSTSGGARPQTAEIIRTFNDKCPQVTVTSRKENADFAILLDHEGGKGVARKDNKVVVFNRDGDAVFSKSTRSLGNAVGDACEAIRRETGK